MHESWLAPTLVIVAAAQAADPHPAALPANVSAGSRPTADAHVVRLFIEKPDEYETGSLHIVYSDGTDVVETVPPKAEPKAEDSQAGFSDLEVASDQKTAGWGETYWKCC
jgi:hypothetical protein